MKKSKGVNSPYHGKEEKKKKKKGFRTKRMIKGSRPGTPLTIDELEKKTFKDYANRKGSVVLDRSQQEGRLNQEVLETKMTLLPYVDDLEYIQLQVQSRIESHQKRLRELEAEESSTTNVTSQILDLTGTTTSTTRFQDTFDKLFLSNATTTTTQEETLEIKREETQSSTPPIDPLTVTTLVRKRYPTCCRMMQTLDAKVPTILKYARPMPWILAVVEHVWTGRTIHESNVRGGSEDGKMDSVNCVSMTRFLLEYLKSKFGVGTLTKVACWDLLSSIETYILDDSLIKMCDVDEDDTKKTNSSFFFKTQNISTSYCRHLVDESEYVRSAVSKGILDELETFSAFVRELRSDEDLLYYLHVRMIAVEFCRKVKNINRGVVVMAPHPSLYDGTRRALLSVKAAESILRLVFRSKCSSHESPESIKHRERLVQFVMKDKLKAHFVHVPGLVPALIASWIKRKKHHHHHNDDEEMTWNLHGEETKLEDPRWISISSFLSVLMEDFRHTDYSIVRALRSDAGDPEGADKCHGLLSINRLVESLNQTKQRQKLVDKLNWEELKLSKKKAKVEHCRHSWETAPRGKNRITARTALLVSENDMRMQEVIVNDTRDALAKSKGHDDHVWKDVMRNETKAVAKRKEEFLREDRGGSNPQTNMTLKRYAMWVEMQISRARKKSRQEKIVSSRIKDRDQLMKELRLRSAVLIQRTFRECLSLRHARNVAMAEVRRRRRIREAQQKLESESATKIANAYRSQRARRELRVRQKAKRRRIRKENWAKHLAVGLYLFSFLQLFQLSPTQSHALLTTGKKRGPIEIHASSTTLQVSINAILESICTNCSS